MEAPVVPIHDASRVPMMIITVFTVGVPAREPLINIPPEIVNRAHSRRMNGM